MPPLSLATRTASTPATIRSSPSSSRRSTRPPPRAARSSTRTARAQRADASSTITRDAVGRRPMPALLDHCFYRQPPGWPAVSDRYPGRADDDDDRHDDRRRATRSRPSGRDRRRGHPRDALARRRAAGRDRRCTRSCATPRPRRRRAPRLRARDRALRRPRIPRHRAPRSRRSTNPRAAPLTAAQMYADRWMFHGPAYQGVTAMGPVGDDGVDGEIDDAARTGRAARLRRPAHGLVGDAAPRSAIASRCRCTIERIELFGAASAPPASASRAACACARSASARCAPISSSSRGGRVWARIDRLGGSPLRQRRRGVGRPACTPSINVLAVPDAGGLRHASPSTGARAASRELMMRRYLGERERADHERSARAAAAAGCSAGSRSRTPCACIAGSTARRRSVAGRDRGVERAERPAASSARRPRLGRAQGRPRGRDRRRGARRSASISSASSRAPTTFLDDRVHARRARARRRQRRRCTRGCGPRRKPSRRRAAPA